MHFSTNLGKTSWKICFLDGNINLGQKCITNLSSHTLSTNCIRRWFLMINNVKSSKNYFCWCSSFLKRIVDPKKLQFEVVKMLSLSLISCFVINTLPKLFNSSNFFASTTWSTSTCFFNVLIPLFLEYEIIPFLNCVLEFVIVIWL